MISYLCLRITLLPTLEGCCKVAQMSMHVFPPCLLSKNYLTPNLITYPKNLPVSQADSLKNILFWGGLVWQQWKKWFECKGYTDQSSSAAVLLKGFSWKVWVRCLSLWDSGVMLLARDGNTRVSLCIQHLLLLIKYIYGFENLQMDDVQITYRG